MALDIAMMVLCFEASEVGYEAVGVNQIGARKTAKIPGLTWKLDFLTKQWQSAQKNI